MNEELGAVPFRSGPEQLELPLDFREKRRGDEPVCAKSTFSSGSLPAQKRRLSSETKAGSTSRSSGRTQL